MNYSYISATFEDTFESSSANNPFADANDLIQVEAGDFIPGIPEHTLKFGGDYFFNPKISVGGDLLYKSGVYVRGDESNQLGRLDDYATVNLRGNYQITKIFNENLVEEEHSVTNSSIRKHVKVLKEYQLIKPINEGGRPEYLELTEEGRVILNKV